MQAFVTLAEMHLLRGGTSYTLDDSAKGEAQLQGDRRFSAVVTSPLAGEAAGWVVAFYPDVAVAIDGDHVELRAEGRSSQNLELIWECALVNERLSVSNSALRASVMADLLP
jgi:hypothetical protein